MKHIEQLDMFSSIYRYTNGKELDQLSLEDKVLVLTQIRSECNSCTDCKLSEDKYYTSIPFADGVIGARVFVLGEAPGKDEIEQGIPFIGKAGRLFNSILAKIDICRASIYITNVCQCRPPDNRTPSTVETRACYKWWNMQLQLVNPVLIIALGYTAAQQFVGKLSMRECHGKQYKYNGITVIPTLHPASYLYGTPDQILTKKVAGWEDWKVIKGYIDEYI